MATKGKVPQTPAAKAKIKKVMGELKRGTLRSGSKSGPKVTKRSQGLAIALSEARKATSNQYAACQIKPEMYRVNTHMKYKKGTCA